MFTGVDQRARIDTDSSIANAPLTDKSNLAIKGVIAIGAMSKMSSVVGRIADANHYSVCIDLSDISDETDWPVEYKYRPIYPMEDACVGWRQAHPSSI